MYSPDSPILDFYPLEFEQDLNSKKQDWEAFVKIPFIDEERLLKAMAGTLLAKVWFCDTNVYFQFQLVIIVSPPRRENGTLGLSTKFSFNPGEPTFYPSPLRRGIPWYRNSRWISSPQNTSSHGAAGIPWCKRPWFRKPEQIDGCAYTKPV